MSIRVKRGTRAQLNAAAAANQLEQGQPYLITDENRLAIGVSASAYEVFAKVSEAGAGSSAWTVVKKTADEARNNTTTLTADSALTIALGVGRYIVRGTVLLSTANANMDYKYDVTFVGTASYTSRVHRHIIAGSAAGTDNETTTIGTGVVPSTAAAGTTTGIARVAIELVIDVTVAGTLQFRWAQNTLDAAALTCLRGSYLEWIST